MKEDSWQSLAYSFCQVDDSRERTKEVHSERELWSVCTRLRLRQCDTSSLTENHTR